MRLLLFEDEEKVAAFVVRGLEAECFAVDVAPEGRSAIDLSNAYQYDLKIGSIRKTNTSTGIENKEITNE